MRPIKRAYFAKGWDRRTHTDQLILVRDEIRRRARELQEMRGAEGREEADLLLELANDVEAIDEMREAWLAEGRA